MVSVGIDVSKGKSTVAITTHYGEIIETPFDLVLCQVFTQPKLKNLG